VLKINKNSLYHLFEISPSLC